MGVSTALLEHLATKLPVSRLQRDLSDSSALRNTGPAFGHAVIALRSTRRGLSRVAVDRDALQRDLAETWEVLAEAVQTAMRAEGISGAYEQLKDLTRGDGISQEGLQRAVASLPLSDDAKRRLLALTPATYVGLAADLVAHVQG